MKKILSVILPAFLVLAFGCSKSETHQSLDGKVKVVQTGDASKVEVMTKDGKATVTASDNGVAIPDTFPKDVPIPKGAVPKMTMSQGKAEMLHLHVAGTVADVVKAYQEELKGQGWEIVTTMNVGDGSMLQAKKAGRSCSAMVMKDDPGSLLQLTVTQE
jgi:hypothetical protein